MVDFDPGATALTIVDLDTATANEGLAIEPFRNFAAGVIKTVGTGAITAFQIVVGTDGDLAGTVIVVAHALGTAPDAVGDTIWLEVNAEDCREVLATATHVGVRLTLATATDECIVFFERANPFHPRDALTADAIA